MIANGDESYTFYYNDTWMTTKKINDYSYNIYQCRDGKLSLYRSGTFNGSCVESDGKPPMSFYSFILDKENGIEIFLTDNDTSEGAIEDTEAEAIWASEPCTIVMTDKEGNRTEIGQTLAGDSVYYAGNGKVIYENEGNLYLYDKGDSTVLMSGITEYMYFDPEENKKLEYSF